MRVLHPAVLLLLCLAIPATLAAQQPASLATIAQVSAAQPRPPVRDPQAVAILNKSLAAMGGAPADSVATGKITIVAGSLTTQGTVRVLTRGLNQSSEQIQTPDISSTVTYSSGKATEVQSSAASPLPLERAVTSQAPEFPSALLSAALVNPDLAYQFVGIEAVDGIQAAHVRFWNTFSSDPDLQQLADFTTTDLWISAGSALPYKLSYTQHEGGGDAPQAPVDIYYSDYRTVNGVLYPYLIKKSLKDRKSVV